MKLKANPPQSTGLGSIQIYFLDQWFSDFTGFHGKKYIYTLTRYPDT